VMQTRHQETSGAAVRQSVLSNGFIEKLATAGNVKAAALSAAADLLSASGSRVTTEVATIA
jgi:hypothetical protein